MNPWTNDFEENIMNSDRRIDSSITSGSQLVSTPGYGASQYERERSHRRWENFDRIARDTLGEVSRFVGPPAETREAVFSSRYLLVGSPAEGEVSLLQTASDDTGIEMASAQMVHPVSVYDLDTGKKIILIP